MLDTMGTKAEEHMDIPMMLKAQGIRMQAIELNMEVFDERQEHFEKGLKENNAATARIESDTKELVQLLNSWKGAMHMIDLTAKMLKPVGIFVGLIASCWGLVATIKGGGK